MATVKYSLDEFISDMEGLLKEQPDQHRIFDRGSSYLEKLIANPAAIPEEFLAPVGLSARGNHGSYALYQGDSGLLITSVVWGPGDHASPHDHGTWGMIGVMGNHLTETRFRRVDAVPSMGTPSWKETAAWSSLRARLRCSSRRWTKFTRWTILPTAPLLKSTCTATTCVD